MHVLANPGKFLRIFGPLLPWLSLIALALIAVGLYAGLFLAPPDYQQGETVRIMYVHVPAAWMALFVYATVAAASAAGLIWHHSLAFVIAQAAVPIGATFTFLALVTGSFWGKPMWGAWWVWDGRLTSVLLLFFLYLGLMALPEAFDKRERGQRMTAILSVIGVVLLPIVKFSVDWWATLHQPASVLRFDGPTIHESQIWPLFVMAGGFAFYCFAVLLVRVKQQILETRLRRLQLASADA
ncbi:MAG: cytochrome c biogenesis protein CcsA [Rhodospirillales bacterium]|nr:cytochrome c biogenesis protein CcsA [Rhodospirillales bacterium]